MTTDELKAMRSRVSAAEYLKTEIDDLKHSISVIQQNTAPFRFECGGGGLPLGSKQALRNAVIIELQRQLAEAEEKFAEL